MAPRGEPTGIGQAFAAAARWFPRSEFAIRKLMSHSEAFRDMCEELAEAERALENVSGIPLYLREARRAEWQELIDGLVAEIGEALRESLASWRAPSVR